MAVAQPLCSSIEHGSCWRAARTPAIGLALRTVSGADNRLEGTVGQQQGGGSKWVAPWPAHVPRPGSNYSVQCTGGGVPGAAGGLWLLASTSLARRLGVTPRQLQRQPPQHGRVWSRGGEGGREQGSGVEQRGGDGGGAGMQPASPDMATRSIGAHVTLLCSDFPAELGVAARLPRPAPPTCPAESGDAVWPLVTHKRGHCRHCSRAMEGGRGGTEGTPGWQCACTTHNLLHARRLRTDSRQACCPTTRPLSAAACVGPPPT